MTLTPKGLYQLAVTRHQQPWNWTFHFTALLCFALSLLTHSYLLFAACVILFGTGFFELSLSYFPRHRWWDFVYSGTEWEKNWIAAPWNARKWLRTAFVLLIVFWLIWSLWTREIISISLLIGFAVLLKISHDNKASGIDP